MKDELKYLTLVLQRLPQWIRSRKQEGPVTVDTPRTWFLIPPHHPAHLPPGMNDDGMASAYVALRSLADTLRRHPRCFRSTPQTQFCWAERSLPRVHAQGAATLILEHGWLPRTSYQISPDGANFHHHLVESDLDALGLIGRGRLEEILRNQSLPSERTEPPVPSDYYVVALQTGNDLNLQHSESEFAAYYSPTREASQRFGQALIDHLQSKTTPHPFLFCQHPADHSKGHYTINSPHTFVAKSTGFRTIDLVAHPRCRGVLSVNSNLLHEAAALGKPVFAFGRLLHRRGESPFPENLEQFLARPRFEQGVMDYLARLIAFQWSLADLTEPKMLEALLRRPREIVPWRLRQQLSPYQ